ncbi:transposase [Candidatus Microgenomates bacterium]|nr:transposase [Candidatus Microgenomates bacterium]
MPSPNIVKSFTNKHFYHIYNRGVEKRTIFNDDLDYRVFLQQFSLLLSSQNLDEDSPLHVLRPRRPNFSKTIKLIAYCLMPNHFHLLLCQLSTYGISEFMRSATTSYVGYFNKRNNRVGGLFQGPFKATHIDNDIYLKHISRYIHLNPSAVGEDYGRYKYSSLRYYDSATCPDWLKPDPVLELFKDSQEYTDFLADYSTNSAQLLGSTTLDDEDL